MNSIIGQMDKQIWSSPDTKVRWWGSDVPLSIPIGFKYAIDAGDEQKMPDIKFPAMVE